MIAAGLALTGAMAVMPAVVGVRAAVGVSSVGVPSRVGGDEHVRAQCLSAFGSLNIGVCVDQPSGGGPSSGGTPWVGIGPTDNGGPGVSTGPLFPGQTINVPLNP